MSYSDPYKLIDHIPRDIDMKVRSRKRPLAQRQAAKLRREQEAQRKAELFASQERASKVWKLICFFGALAVVAGALVTGAWE